MNRADRREMKKFRPAAYRHTKPLRLTLVLGQAQHKHTHRSVGIDRASKKR